MEAVGRKTARVQHRPARRSNERRSVTQHPRRRILSLAAGAAALPTLSWAQTYPTRPITVIMPFAAGGPGDVLGRIVSEHMSRTLGQLLVVENVVGAGGTIGTTRTMRANPNGYTIQEGTLGTHVAALAFYPHLPYDPEKDFAPIGLIEDQALLHPSGIEGLIILARGPRYSARGFPA